jgi:hypothetical protein
MTTEREGGCACGSLRYRLTSEPLIIHCCHCLNCQRQTGSAFVVNLLIEADRVELIAGKAHQVRVPREHGKSQVIHRCERCQVAVFSEYGTRGVYFVRSGTLDAPRDIKPDVHIYTRSRVDWVALPDDAPAVEGFYDAEKLWPKESLRRLQAVASPPA